MMSDNPGSKPPNAASHKRFAVLAAVTLLALALAGALATSSSAGTTEANALTLNWAACPDGAEGWQCAGLTVPLDYAHPEGASIELALTRLPAGDPTRRIAPKCADGGRGELSRRCAVRSTGLPLPMIR